MCGTVDSLNAMALSLRFEGMAEDSWPSGAAHYIVLTLILRCTHPITWLAKAPASQSCWPCTGHAGRTHCVRVLILLLHIAHFLEGWLARRGLVWRMALLHSPWQQLAKAALGVTGVADT